jgi:hypothetical protein
MEPVWATDTESTNQLHKGDPQELQLGTAIAGKTFAVSGPVTPS